MRIKNHYNQGKSHPNYKYTISKSYLIKQYIINKKSAYQIAKELVCSYSTIYRNLKKYNINIRTNSEAKIGKYIGKNNPNYKHGKRGKNFHKFCKCGKEISHRAKRCRKCANQFKSLIYRGIKASNYIHGKGNTPYPLKFSNLLKKEIKIRDDYKCQNCNMNEQKHLKLYHRKLEIHHINYNKFDCLKTNLITLCGKCNRKANGIRDYWFAYFTYIMEQIYGT